MRWFISDLHFYHKNIIHLQDRPYTSVEEMNETLIASWNNTVAKGDVVYIIGDFSFGKYDETKAIVEKLNGVKVLIRGNHDSRFTSSTFIKLGFNDVYDHVIIKLEGIKVVLSHYPYNPPWYKQLWEKVRRPSYTRWYTQFRLNDYGMPLIHGHNHSGPNNFYKTNKGTKCINVAWDISKRFISEKEIINFLKD